MKDVRRSRLLELLASPRFNGDRGKFCQDAGITNGRMTQLLDPKEPFGDVAAKNLIGKLNLAHGYFDTKNYTMQAEAGTYRQAVPSLEQITEALAGYLSQMDDDARDDAADVLRKLTRKPENHARAAAMLVAAFQSGRRKVA